MKPIRILLADDHALVRAGLRSLLEAMPGIEVVAEAADGAETLDQIGQHHPDIVLLDIIMPRLNGLETALRISQNFPDVKVIILSMNVNEEYVLRALRAGSAGYLVKNISPAELELALRAVAKGERYLSSGVTGHVMEDYLKRMVEKQTPLDRLTPRQREILQLIAEGHTSKEIAKMLGLSISTIESHRTQLMAELDIHDIAGLVRFAIRTGIITLNHH